MEKFPTPGTSTRSSESQQNILLDSLPYPVWLKDAAGCYVYVNQSFLYFHGFSLEGVLSARDDDLFSPELSADYQSKDQLVVSRGEGLRSVEMSQRGDGHKIAVETTRTPVFDDRGDVVALSGIMRVIDPVSEGQSLTDVWSQTENGARSSGRLGWPVVGILHIDPAANVLSASPAAVNALGYDTTEEMMSALSGPENRFYLNPEDREGIVRAIRETGKAENIETSVQRKDGAVLRALLNFDFVRGDGGTTTSLEGTIQDVTENRKAEMALSLAEEKYRNIFENAIEGIFQMAPDGRIISANPALARIFGYESPEELMTDVSNLDARVYGNEKRRRETSRLRSAVETGAPDGFRLIPGKSSTAAVAPSIMRGLSRAPLNGSVSKHSFGMRNEWKV
jgi:PAS domain S-box-containing protein